MEVGTNKLRLILLIVVVGVGLTWGQYDTLRVQSTIDSLSQHMDSLSKQEDSIKQTINLSMLPDSAVLDSINQTADSLVNKFTSFHADSQYQLFMKGINQYKQRKYFEALKNFKELNEIPISENRFLEASDMMMVKTYLRMGKINKALSLGYEFETYYDSEVEYLDDVRYSIARALFKKEKYSESLTYYLQVVKQDEDSKLISRTMQEMGTLVDIFMNIKGLKQLYETYSDNFFKPYFSLKLAEKYHEKGQENQANSYFNSVTNKNIKSNFIKEEIREVSKYLDEVQKKRIYIGIILPFSGPGKTISKKILRGIKFALNEVRKSKNVDIAGIVMDNQADFIRTVKQTRFLVKNPRVKAIVGALSSKNTIGISAVANQAEVPFLSPTATNSRITEIGNWGFQANVDFTYRGRFLAKYCIRQNDIRNMVTLSPGGDFGVNITDAFSKTIDKGGIKILTQEWYSGSPEDLSPEFKEIRKIGLEIEKNKINKKINRLTDSLNRNLLADTSKQNQYKLQIVSADTNDYKYKKIDKGKIVSTKKALTIAGLADSTEIYLPEDATVEHKINTIDAIFLPVTSQNLDMIISQLDYHNVDAQVFGSADWNSLQKLRTNDNILDSTVFVSDYYINHESKQYRQFANSFHNLMGKIPERFDIYGYDSVQPLLKAFTADYSSRSEIKKYLLNMPTYRGIARNISFQGNRPGVNSCAFILSYRNNEIVPVAIVEKGRVVNVR